MVKFMIYHILDEGIFTMQATIGARYQIQQEIGAGGMGMVYLGKDTLTNILVAIKKLKPQITTPELIERFQREGEALRALNHPNIVKLLDTIQEDDQYYLVMTYVDGGDLSKRIAQGGLSISEILHIGIDLSDALTRAHKLDIIHRDLKPANILISEDGTILLTDFGVAHFGAKQRLTEADNIVGTVDYLAPEVFETGISDKRIDIWAFGVILFEMLTGTRPFFGANVSQVMMNIVTGVIPDIEAIRPDAPAGLVDLIYRMLNRNPEERIPSMRLVGAELEALSQGASYTPITKPYDKKPNLPLKTIETTPSPKVKHNLPRQNTPFVGREYELNTISKLLNDPNVPLVCIMAQGGMGKTRLSIEIGKQALDNFIEGVYFVELAPISTPDDIPKAIADAVGYPLGTGDPKANIIHYFKDKRYLLILDNFEHVIAGRDVVQGILQTSETKIIVTSRERLNLSGETIFQLEGMDFPQVETTTDALSYAAIRLLLESAKRVRGDFVLDDQTLPHAIHICQIVHGLPLGIVLAASWLDALSLKEIGEEISQSIDFLETTLYDIPARQRSLRAVFDYSWNMLAENEQQTFAKLSVFRGGITREAIQAVSDANIRTLQTLVNKSLLYRHNVTGRYEIHEMLRQYGEGILNENGLTDSTRHKHMIYYANLMTKLLPDVHGNRQIPALHEIDDDFENIKLAWRYACQTADSSAISQMIDCVHWYCAFRHLVVEATELFSLARSVWADESPIALRLMSRYPATNDTKTVYETALALAKKQQNMYEIAFCSRQLGVLLSHHMVKGNMENSRLGIQFLEESATLFDQLKQDFCTAYVLDDLGWSYRLLGRIDTQQVRVEQSIKIRREIGDKIGMANSLRNMGGVLGGFGGGRIEALEKWQEALALSHEINSKFGVTWNSYMVGVFYQFEGEFDKAQPYIDIAFELSKEIREETVYGSCLLSRALRLVIEEKDETEAQALMAKGFPPNTVDLRMIIFNTLEILLACKHGDLNQQKKAGASFGDFMRHMNVPFSKLRIILVIVISYNHHQYEDAIKWLGYYEQFPPYKLTRFWGWATRLRDALKAKFAPPKFDELYAIGKHWDNQFIEGALDEFFK